MDKPSLQIGNEKWAIKEDELLGYSTAGTRFVPQSITMTRASAGTRVNPQGLIETVELLGSELLPNLNLSTNWTGIGGTSNVTVDTFTTTSTGGVRKNNFLTVGKIYRAVISGTTTSTQSQINNFSNNVGYKSWNGAGAFNFTFTFTATNDTGMYLRHSASGTTEVYSFSVKELTQNNLARVDYDGTASSLLVEPQRTNLFTYSEDFSKSSWNKSNIDLLTLTSDIAPNGTSNSVYNFKGDDSNLFTNSQSSSVEYTMSFYVKSNGNGKDNFKLRLGSGFSEFTATNEWVRYFYKATPTSQVFGISSNSIDSDVLIWGAQIEAASYPTSYIPTSGSTVTRVQETYTKTGISNLINSEEGVLFVESAALADDGTNRILTLSDNSYNNSLRIQYYTNTNEIEMRAVVGGAVQALQRVAITNVLEFNKIAFLYKVNDFQLWVNGSKLRFDTSGTVPPTGTYNTLSFDDGDGNNIFFSKVKQLQVFKTALTDTELAALTS